MEEALKSSGRTAMPPPAKAPAAPAKAPAVGLPSAKGRGRKKKLGRRFLESPAVQGAAASLATGYLRLVSATSRFSFDPADPYARYVHLAPVIFTMWHGQHFMLPFARIFDFDVRVLISRHRDGEINARVAEKLGIRTIRGSTARDPSRMIEKGGMVGFLEMKAALEEGASRAGTAPPSTCRSAAWSAPSPSRSPCRRRRMPRQWKRSAACWRTR